MTAVQAVGVVTQRVVLKVRVIDTAPLEERGIGLDQDPLPLITAHWGVGSRWVDGTENETLFNHIYSPLKRFWMNFSIIPSW